MIVKHTMQPKATTGLLAAIVVLLGDWGTCR